MNAYMQIDLSIRDRWEVEEYGDRVIIKIDELHVSMHKEQAEELKAKL